MSLGVPLDYRVAGVGELADIFFSVNDLTGGFCRLDDSLEYGYCKKLMSILNSLW